MSHPVPKPRSSAPKLLRGAVAAGLFLSAPLYAGCGSSSSRVPSAKAPVPPSSAAATTEPPATTTPATVTTTARQGANRDQVLAVGDTGQAVTDLQHRLSALGYWVGPTNGSFGDSTEQAVYALQKAAGITADGEVDPETRSALARGVRPAVRSTAGYVIEVDLADDLVMFVDQGRLEYVLNTSTGGGYTYTEDGESAVAATPQGRFTIIRQVDGMVVDSLGELWRPKFFYSGFAIHGDSYVPPDPVSHGCVRVSNEAIDWIWSANLAPLGTAVWVYR